MRSLFYTALVLATMATFQACDSSGRLAESIVGSWRGVPETLDMPPEATAVSSPVYTFTREQGTNGGTVALTLKLKTSKPVNPFGDPQPVPVMAQAEGTATLTGTWKAVDDDEIFVMFDAPSISVEVDSATVAFTPANAFDGPTEAPAPETLKAGISEQLKQELVLAVERKYLTNHHLDDVKVKDGTVKWEIGDVDYMLTSAK